MHCTRFKSVRVLVYGMNVLSIAGSDPSSGAGIQGDLRTFAALGHNGFSVVTAVTSQNSSGFAGAEPVSPGLVRSQMDSVLGDFRVDAIKIGMVYSSKVIGAVRSGLAGVTAPMVLDPVIESTTGGTLLQKEAVPDYLGLLPLAFAVTPNAAEAEALTGVRVRAAGDAPKAAQRLRDMGARNVIITGLESGGSVSDCVCTESGVYSISARRIGRQVHGSGCAYSAALAASISTGLGIDEAARLAKRYAADSIRQSRRIGGGIAVAGASTSGMESEMQDAVRRLVGMENIHRLIPEVQMNFGYSRTRPRSRQDVLAVQGRIVRSGRGAIVAGPLVFGGSRHVASAILQMNKKFPHVRSALNIRLGQDVLKRMQENGMTVLSYDRRGEPDDVRRKEGGSVSWGIRTALDGAASAPDAIFHEGGPGKEPMIMVFGDGPGDIVRKVGLLL